MENFSYSSYPDSGDSSPLSREIDADNQSWEEQPSAAYKVKFMCSYGGKIQPRPHDNQLAYIGGDTKILSVDRNIKFSAIMAKLSSLCSTDGDICFKYQLPGEDLDALISVTNDEDLEHMMLEYDRLYRASAKPARLRLFLFLLNPPPASAAATAFGGGDAKTERQWFVDALNSVQIQNLEGSSPPAATVAGNPDFLFGLDKVKAPDLVTPAVPTVPEVVAKDITTGSDCGLEDRHMVGEPVSPAEIQRQIQELQMLQIAANQEQGILRRNNDESLPPRAFTQDYYKIQEKIAPAAAPGSAAVQVPIPATYFPVREMPSGYPVTAAPPPGSDQPVYFIPSSVPGVYPPQQALRPGTGPTGQPIYGVQRVVPEMYREQPQYNTAAVTGSMQVQQPKVAGYSEGVSMVPARAGVDTQYIQVGYDGAGRQVYYTTPYPAVAAVASGGALNQDGKVAVNAKAPQTSSV